MCYLAVVHQEAVKQQSSQFNQLNLVMFYSLLFLVFIPWLLCLLKILSSVLAYVSYGINDGQLLHVALLPRL